MRGHLYLYMHTIERNQKIALGRAMSSYVVPQTHEATLSRDMETDPLIKSRGQSLDFHLAVSLRIDLLRKLFPTSLLRIFSVLIM